MIDSVATEEGGAGKPDLKKPRARKRPASQEAVVSDRLPPHSAPAERGVLGCILLAPKECMGECIERIKEGRLGKDEKTGRENMDVFFDLRHQILYENLVEMHNSNEAIDLITVQERLKVKKQLDAVGGVVYVSALADEVPSPANLSYYLNIVRDKFYLRRIISSCSSVIADTFEFEGEVDRLLDEVETRILRLSEDRVEESSSTMNTLVHEAINTIEDYYQREGGLTGLPTGFTDLDRMTSGLHGGEMIVIAARPSMGKTSLAMNIAEHIAVDHDLPVGVFSLEMSASSLVLRMLCSRARVNLRSIRDGFLAERDFPRLTNAASKLGKAPIHIDDTAGLSILQLRAKARRMWQQHGIKLFVIDYLQLLHSSSRRSSDNRQQEIAEISNGIKALAKELDVPVIVLAQLNRELEKRERGAQPKLSDLRESGAIEQDADLVGLLYKPFEKDEADDDEGGVDEASSGQRVNLLVAKQRNGPTGDVEMVFLKGFTRYENLSRVDAADIPSGN